MILVIGGVTIDKIHFSGEMPNAGQSASTPGGAGMYTAGGAFRAGGNVSLFAQRPHPLPKILVPVAANLHWIGPRIQAGDLPRLEIVHYGGGKAELKHAFWGAQTRLLPNVDLPKDLSDFDYVHIAAMGTAQRQIEFLRTCRDRGAGRISAGTYAKVVYGETASVRKLFEESDLFFLNENEAIGLFGGRQNAQTEPGKQLFVTLGEKGVLVIDGRERNHIPAPRAVERDPTGAGDTFCGATLAGLDRGLEAVSAAREGVRIASRMIQSAGPQELFNS